MIQDKIILIYFLVTFIILPNQLHLHIPSQYYKIIPSLTSFYYPYFFFTFLLAFKFLEPKTTKYILFIVSFSALFERERERERSIIVHAQIWTKILFKSLYLCIVRERSKIVQAQIWTKIQFKSLYLCIVWFILYIFIYQWFMSIVNAHLWYNTFSFFNFVWYISCIVQC